MKRLIFILISLSPAFGYQETGQSNGASDELLSEVHQLMQQGRYQRAEERLKSGSSTDPFVLRLLLELAKREGREDETNTYARRLLALHQSGQLKGSEEIAQAAYGAWQLGLFQDANQIFMEADKIKPTAVSMFVDWGHLYLTKYNASEAESIFRDGIKTDHPSSGYLRWGVDAAYVGLAQALDSQFKPGVAEALEKAVELNPQNLEALAFRVLLAIEKSQWKESRDWLKKGLDINSLYLPLLELKCALEYFRQDTEAFEKTRQQVLNINPNDGDLFETLGNLASTQRRFEQAIEFYREALVRNLRQESARASLGINLLRIGQEEEGKQILEVAYARDPFNIWTVNTLRLLDSFDRFVRFETPHFRVKLHEKEAAALRPYVEELTERSVTTLEQKYNHQVSGKYVFEMYPDHADFAVRTLGLPGLGALGATFGRIVAMDSPSARPKGEFHWGSTLWHEIAHVVTLSLSNDKVPRWFTEGISMMEERQAGAGWGEYLNVGFVRAYQNDDLLPLSDLNSGFEQPKSPQHLVLSYFQAGWLCEFLVLRYGVSKIRAMLVAFGKGATTQEVFQQVLEASVEEIDEQFRQELDKSLKPLTGTLQVPGDSPLRSILQGEPQAAGETQDDLEDLQKSWQANRNNYFLNLRLGSKLKSLGRLQEAIPYLEKALELFPTQADRTSPYSLLTEIYEELGQTDSAREMRRRWWSAAPLYIENVHRLASLLSDRNQLQEAAQYLEEAMYVNPFQSETHERLGDIYLQSSQTEKAVREFEVFLSLTSVDAAAAHYKLAQALFQSGDTQRARSHVLLSLEIAPGYQEAQKLLLKLVRK
ncbi:tetratricopeptide repeat protein [Acidobacteria bacterium AH-259-D05]|nr:tetratricopeptide repeat protein [Acidobacteria bacterium AH-259-D05]